MKLYRYYNILSFQLFLKNTLAVTELTLFFGEYSESSCCQLKGAAAVKNIFKLDPISAYILNR